ncbi:MAG: hypothetical protein R2712_11795 [Vicinamibacterales bacterium]
MRITPARWSLRASELASQPDFDPLGVTIAAAHAAGIRVHAWVAVNLISSAVTLPSSRDHVVYKNPEWLMVPRDLAPDLRAVDTRSPGTWGSWPAGAARTGPRSKGCAPHRCIRPGRARGGGGEGDGHPLRAGRHPSRLRAVPERLRLQPRRASPSSRTPSSRSSRPRSGHGRRNESAFDPFAYPNLFLDRWAAFAAPA